MEPDRYPVPIHAVPIHASVESLEARRRAQSRAAEAAIVRSRQLIAVAQRNADRARQLRLGSRKHLVVVSVEGCISDQPVQAVIRSDGHMTTDRILLDRANLVVALGETFDDGRVQASIAGNPLAVALTLARACDRLDIVDISIDGFGRSQRRRRHADELLRRQAGELRRRHADDRPNERYRTGGTFEWHTEREDPAV